ncbi:MAG: hypothetical protein AAGB26_12605 [Planctomycetota bacterium]
MRSIQIVYLCVLALCLVYATDIAAQQDQPDRPHTLGGSDLDPSTLRPTHQIGQEVPVMPAGLVTNHGDKLILGWATPVRYRPRTIEYLKIFYLHTIGEDTAKVIYRDVRVGGPEHITVGADGVPTMEGGYGPVGWLPHVYREEDMASMSQLINEDRPLDGYPVSVGHGAVYQEARETPRSPVGATFYTPRKNMDFVIEDEIQIAEAGFVDLNSNRGISRRVLSNDHFVVVVNDEQTVARVLELATGRVREITIELPESYERFWDPCFPVLGSRYLFAGHGLYDPATGERVDARQERSPARQHYSSNFIMHDGIGYGVQRIESYDHKTEQRTYRYSVIAFLPIGHESQMIKIAALDNRQLAGDGPYHALAPQFFAGDGGLVYSDGKKWVKTGWLKLEDFKKP